VKPYYDEGGITLYCGRCEEVLPMLTEKFRLVFTSPPYNLGNTVHPYSGFPNKKLGHYPNGAKLSARGGHGKWSGGSLANGYGAHDDAMPHEEYVAWQQAVLRLCWGALDDSGAIYYNHKPRIMNGVLVPPAAYLPPELPVRQEVIWARAGGINFSPAFYLPTHERIVIVAKPDFRLKSKGASGAGDVWQFTQEHGNSHPAPFPLGLPTAAIETTGCKSILDPFAGSGTTLRAAKDAQIRGVGIELEEQWCEYTARRLEQGVLAFG